MACSKSECVSVPSPCRPSDRRRDELDRQELSDYVQPGDCVEFNVQEPRAGARISKPVAISVNILQPGSVAAPRQQTQHHNGSTPDAPGTRCVAEVTRELRGGQRRREEAYGGRLKCWAHPPPSEVEPVPDLRVLDFLGEVEFTGESLDAECPRLAVGNKCLVWVSHNSSSGALRASGIQLLRETKDQGAGGGHQAAAGLDASEGQQQPVTEGDVIGANAAQGRDVGRIAMLRDSYGFVRVHPASQGPATRPGSDVPARLFFHFSQVEGGFNNVHIIEGLEVSFAIGTDRRSGKITAQSLRVLPRGALPMEPRKGGVSEGDGPAVPISRADASSSWARAAPLPSEHQVGGGDAISSDWSALEGLELGVILTVRDKYGFIRCVDRPNDLFFHIDTVVSDGVPRDELRPGRDVAFAYGSDPRDASRPVATRVRLAPPGTAVFDDVSEERLLGVVAHRIPSNKPGTGKPGEVAQAPMGAIQYTPAGNFAAESGDNDAADPDDSLAAESVEETVTAVEGEQEQDSATVALTPADVPDDVPDGDGAGTSDVDTAMAATDASGGGPGSMSLPFGTADLMPDTHPRPGDIVEFSIATNRRTRAQRATRVCLPLRTGVVVVVKPTFGFLQPTDKLHLPHAAPKAAGTKAAGSQRGGKHGKTVFFHASEVAGHLTLNPRDEVEFLCCLNPKTGEPNARRVRRTKEAPQSIAPAHTGRHDTSIGGAEPRPEGLRRDRDGAAVGRTARVVEGPQPGQKGFSFGRGRTLEPIQYGLQSMLRPGATPFSPPMAVDNERHADA